MANNLAEKTEQLHYDEKVAPAIPGMPMLLVNTVLMLGFIALLVFAIIRLEAGGSLGLWVTSLVLASVYLLIIGPIGFIGLKIVKPKEALVLTLFGKYYGTIREEGYYFVNPFVTAVNPLTQNSPLISLSTAAVGGEKTPQNSIAVQSKAISLKAITLNNERQKINDLMGNPINIGIVVIWRVVNTAKAVFNVDNYMEFLSIQTDSALRDIVRNYPYDTPGEDTELTLRGSSQEIAAKLQQAIQAKVDVAGLEILEARITHLAYAQEIAAAMLQRQQASAIIDARQMIVEGAVGMVEMALDRLSDNKDIHLDEERKATMISNLLVVLCGNKDVQPVVNSGSIY